MFTFIVFIEGGRVFIEVEEIVVDFRLFYKCIKIVFRLFNIYFDKGYRFFYVRDFKGFYMLDFRVGKCYTGFVDLIFFFEKDFSS